MPAILRTPLAAIERALRSAAPAPTPSRLKAWRTVQLAVAVAGTMALIQLSSIFAGVPDMAPGDRWEIVIGSTGGHFAAVAAQLAILHLAVLPQSTPWALRWLRFGCMVSASTLINTAPLLLNVDTASVRIGLVESMTTIALFSMFNALLTATFLVYQQSGQARSEEAARRLQQLQREQRAARRRLVEAQLQAMQARVDPQMFFDVLDAVQRLYATDASRAEAMLDELVVFLRAALPRLRSASSTLAQEFELAASYFRLQTLRGIAPAAVHIALPDGLASHAFPAGVILPLVSDTHSGVTEVNARRGAGGHDITVSLRFRRAPTTRALEQVRETLTALYGSAATLECRETVPDANIETRITLADDTP
jgi:hypothetical protein